MERFINVSDYHSMNLSASNYSDDLTFISSFFTLVYITVLKITLTIKTVIYNYIIQLWLKS